MPTSFFIHQTAFHRPHKTHRYTEYLTALEKILGKKLLTWTVWLAAICPWSCMDTSMYDDTCHGSTYTWPTTHV